ncbi:MAG: hypothetical protein RLY16_1296 [Bacteroidota bacterium]
MKPAIKAHIGLLFTNLFFAINLSAVKYLTGNMLVKPFGLNVIRVGVSVILFWLMFVMAPGKTQKIERKDWGRFFWCALAGIAINQLLFLKGLSLTYSIHAGLLMLTTPILITIIAAWILKEKINSFKIIGLFLGIAGATILIAGREKTGNGNDVLLGDCFILINAISYTGYFILVKPLMQRYPPIQVMRMIFTIGFFMVLPFGYQEFVSIPWQQYDSIAYQCLVLIVIGGTFLAYLFNIYGIQHLGAAKAGSYIYSQPVFATIIAMTFLHESLSWTKIIAAVFIFNGVYLCNYNRSAQIDKS